MQRILPLALCALSTSALAQVPANPEPTPSFPRCLTPERDPSIAYLVPPGDCTIASTNPTADYDPVNTYEIPVVVHVIQRTNGQGALTNSKVQSQIDILNEDFGALPGTNGAAGVDTGIRFRLATVDPNGNSTNGITRSTNNTWFNDGGSYWNSLAWDPSRYLNIYTNSGGGALGYVPYLPQEGPAGSASDRVVVAWDTFGRNAAGGAPYNQGRTTTHEVGHYLGLFHTFDGGCGQSSAPGCYSSGDLICDTNRQNQPNYDCSNGGSCGSPDPFRNYMDYTDDLCMQGFSLEQTRRMRCTLEGYRQNVYEDQGGSGGGGSIESFCTALANSSGLPANLAATGSTSVSSNDLVLTADGLPGLTTGIFIMSPDEAQMPLGNGILCLGSSTLGFIVRLPGEVSNASGFMAHALDLSSPAFPEATVLPGATWSFQCWFRDNAAGGSGFNLSNGLRVTFD